MKSHKSLFTQALAHIPAHSHAAAHSHHLRPDCILEAHNRCAEDALALADKKWGHIYSTIIPQAQAHIARHLNTAQPESVTFAPNTHEFVLRLVSCLPTNRPARILTTDSEFYSAARQFARLEEAGLAQITRIAVEPFADFPARFADAAARGEYDMVFFSHVFFNSGYAVPDLTALVKAVLRAETFIVIDGYHSFMALPVDLSALKNRAFFMAGGYKYAMAGEGCCFLHVPPGYGPRPVNTGWFAGPMGAENQVSYAATGERFAGSTFDPAGLYRLNAVMEMLVREALTPAVIHDHVLALQERFMQTLPREKLVVPLALHPRGNFLTFRTEKAQEISEILYKQHGIYTDHRADRLRFGFGIYHDFEDIDSMAALAQAVLR